MSVIATSVVVAASAVLAVALAVPDGAGSCFVDAAWMGGRFDALASKLSCRLGPGDGVGVAWNVALERKLGALEYTWGHAGKRCEWLWQE